MTSAAGATRRALAVLDARAELAVFAVATTAYAWVAAPGVAWMDAGELTAAAWTLGGGHPPGQPLHALVGKAVALVPIGEIGFRVGLVSALAMAAALAGVVALGRALVAGGAARAAAIVGATLAGLAPAAEVNAGRAEVYAPAAALLVWAAVFAVRAGRGGAARDVLLAALLAALAAGFHPLTAAAVALPLALSIVRARGRRCARLLVPTLALGALALAAYAYLPLRTAAASPPLLHWGDPGGWAGLRDVVFGAAYQGNFALGGVGARANGAIALVLVGSGLAVALGGLVGLALATATGLRGAATLLAVAAMLVLEVALQRAFNPDLGGYLLPALLVLAAGLAPLVEGVRRLAGVGDGERARAAVAAVVLTPILTAGLLAPPSPARDDGDDPTRLHAATLGAMPPGPGLYLASGDATLFAALYERLVAGARPDLALAHGDLVRDRWFLALVDRLRPELAVPYVDDGVRGDLLGRLVRDNLGRGLPVGADTPRGARSPSPGATPLGRGYLLSLAPEPGATPPPPAPLDFRGEVGVRIARSIALARGGFEAERGRLAAAARAVGAAGLDVAAPVAGRPPLLAYLPPATFAFISEPWQIELFTDELRWRAGLEVSAVGEAAPLERRLHAAWRALLVDGAAAMPAAAAAIGRLGGDAEVATRAMLAGVGSPLAEPWLAAAIERRPDDGAALALRASLRANRGDLVGAEDDFRRAVAAPGAVAETFARYGVVLARMGRRAEADAMWRRALALEPGRADVRAWLAE